MLSDRNQALLQRRKIIVQRESLPNAIYIESNNVVVVNLTVSKCIVVWLSIYIYYNICVVRENLLFEKDYICNLTIFAGK